MKNTFVFDGNWNTRIKLAGFNYLSNPMLTSRDADDDSRSYGLQILDEHNDDPDPADEQVNAINFLLQSEHQQSILEKLVDYIQEVVYPDFQEGLSYEDYPEIYPDLHTVEDLYQVIAIENVSVYTLYKDSCAYTLLECESCLDYEHGIAFTLHQSRIVDHGQVGDMESEKLLNELDLTAKEYLKKYVRSIKSQETVLYTPHPKYNQLKPWQENVNNNYPYRLLQSNQLKTLSKFLKENNHRERYALNLLNAAISDNQQEGFDLLISIVDGVDKNTILRAIQRNQVDFFKRMLEVPFLDFHLQAQGEYSLLYSVFRLLKDYYKHANQRDELISVINFLVKRGFHVVQDDATCRLLKEMHEDYPKAKVERVLNDALKEAGYDIVKLSEEEEKPESTPFKAVPKTLAIQLDCYPDPKEEFAKLIDQIIAEVSKKEVGPYWLYETMLTLEESPSYHKMMELDQDTLCGLACALMRRIHNVLVENKHLDYRKEKEGYPKEISCLNKSYAEILVALFKSQLVFTEAAILQILDYFEATFMEWMKLNPLTMRSLADGWPTGAFLVGVEAQYQGSSAPQKVKDRIRDFVSLSELEEMVPNAGMLETEIREVASRIY